MKITSLLFTCVLSFTLLIFPQKKSVYHTKNYADDIAIHTYGNNRIFTFTNKAFGQFHGETNAYTNDGWRGWVFREQKIFTDYAIAIAGKPLERKSAKVSVTPYNVTREYSNNVKESFFFADFVDLFSIELKNIVAFQFSLNSFSGIDGKQISHHHFEYSLGSILPGYSLSVISNSEMKLLPLSSGKLFEVSKPLQSTKLIFVVHKASLDEKVILSNLTAFISAKRDRINYLLARSFIETNDAKFNQAYLWSVASFDALVTTQEAKGIFAGLPWFNNNWGRDTFISLPGCFVTGNYKDAKEILEAFAAYQDTVPSSQYFGRIPNRVTLKDIIYNTTDGTPWFIIQCANYYKYTGDNEFIQKIYPKIKLALQGALKNHVDSQGFLTHLDAETWMDAVGPDGPWSPRGNRANDIQVFWYKELEITNTFAKLLNDAPTVAETQKYIELVGQNISANYIDTKTNLIADRIRTDNTKDFTLRPNAFFVLNEKKFFNNEKTRVSILKNTMASLVLPYGVLSLDYHDANFHPFHEYAPYYPKDAAYHNGTIWQWNNGPIVEALCSVGLQDSAWSLTTELTRQILNEGAVGSIAELMETMPRKNTNEIKLSGAFSQAWSLGEYLRTIHQNYFGVQPDVINKTIYIAPHLPKAIHKVVFYLMYGRSRIQFNYVHDNDNFKIEIAPSQTIDDIILHISVPDNNNNQVQVIKRLHKFKKVSFSFPLKDSQSQKVIATVNNKQETFASDVLIPDTEVSKTVSEITFAHIEKDRKFPVLQTETSELISHETIKRSMGSSAHVIIDKNDQAGDEQYQYPTHPFFKKGILDITNFKLADDDSCYYFEISCKKLVNPNWHPEYGFQLTFAGIYIRTKRPGLLTTIAGKNSKYAFDEKRSFNRVVLVSGGVEIKDGSNKSVALYAPQKEDASNPLGNSETGVISFSIPKKYLGEITKDSPISILVGAQDDHGGSGIGEFREVQALPAEWFGGGKMSPDGNNIYDFLFIN